MDCFNRLSLWVAATVKLFVSRAPLVRFFSWLEVYGGACPVERLGTELFLIRPISLSFMRTIPKSYRHTALS
jgi:hypothetical protein